jgi:hypothetical protein
MPGCVRVVSGRRGGCTGTLPVLATHSLPRRRPIFAGSKRDDGD